MQLQQSEAHRGVLRDPVRSRGSRRARRRALHVVDGRRVLRTPVAPAARRADLPRGGDPSPLRGRPARSTTWAAFSAGISVASWGPRRWRIRERLAALARFGKRLAVSLDSRGSCNARLGGAIRVRRSGRPRLANRPGRLDRDRGREDGEAGRTSDCCGARRGVRTAGHRGGRRGGGEDLEVLEAEPAVRGAVVGRRFTRGR